MMLAPSLFQFSHGYFARATAKISAFLPLPMSYLDFLPPESKRRPVSNRIWKMQFVDF